MSDHPAIAPDKMTFERCADATIDKVRAIYAQRGEGYGDTWAVKNCSFAVARATLARIGFAGMSTEEMRLLALAFLSDVKDSRLIGSWNPDSVIDGIAYRAAYCELRSEYEAAAAAPQTSSLPCAGQP